MAFTSFSNLTIERNDTLDDLGFDSNLSRPIISEGGDSGSDDVTDAVTTLGGDITTLENSLTEVKSVILDYEASGTIAKGDVCEFDGSDMKKVSGEYVWQYDSEITGLDSSMENDNIIDTVRVSGTNFIAFTTYNTTDDYFRIRLFDTTTNTFSDDVYSLSNSLGAASCILISPKDNYIVFDYSSGSYRNLRTIKVDDDGTMTYKGESRNGDMCYPRILQKYNSDIVLYVPDDEGSQITCYSFVFNENTEYYVYKDYTDLDWASGSSLSSSRICGYNERNRYIFLRKNDILYRTYFPINSDGTFNASIYHISPYASSLVSLGSKSITYGVCDYAGTFFWISKDGVNTYIGSNGSTTLYSTNSSSPIIQPKYTGCVLTDSPNSIYRLYDSYSTYTNISQVSVMIDKGDDLGQSTIGYTSNYNLYLIYHISNRFRCRYFSKPIVYNYDDAVAIAQESVSSGNTGSFRLLRASDIDSTRTDLTTGTKYYDDIGLAVSPTQLYIIKDISDIIS